MRPEFASYADGWQQRRLERRARCRQRQQRARDCVVRLAGTLRKRFGAGRVWVFGSLVPGRFGMDSDIDLAVDGLPRHALFAAGAEVEREAEDFRVDLVPLEDAPAHIRNRILPEGELIEDEPAD